MTGCGLGNPRHGRQRDAAQVEEGLVYLAFSVHRKGRHEHLRTWRRRMESATRGFEVDPYPYPGSLETNCSGGGRNL